MRAAISSLYSNTDYYFNPLPKSAALRHNSRHVRNAQNQHGLAEHYGFTPEELDFIINYDIKYRMGADEGNVISSDFISTS